MKLRHALLAIAASAALALPAVADDAPRGKDRRDGQRSHQKDHDRGADRRSDRHDNARDRQRQRFREARREIRRNSVERRSEREHRRTHASRGKHRPSAHDLLRERRRHHNAERRHDRDRHHYRRRHNDRRHNSGVTIDFHIGNSRDYCPPPRSYRTTRTVVIERPVVERRRRTVVVERPVTRPRYVEQAWEDLERGRHRAALDAFGILASSHHYNATYKIGYGLAAAGLHDDAVAAIAMRRALSVDAAQVHHFLPSSGLTHDLRALERRYDRAARANPYDQDAVFLLAVIRTLQGESITPDDLEDDFQMLASEDRELLGLAAPAPSDAGMYGP